MNDLLKIDSLVAEKVMGWKLNKMGGFYYWVDEKGNDKARASTWQPTLCMSDAWQVVEKLGETFEVRIRKDYSYFCEVDDRISPGETVTVSEHRDYTAPLAICLAALKAVGIEIEMEESNNE